jgi:hypothetical protein
MAAGNQAILLLVSILLFAKYVQALRVATVELSSGGSRMFERLLLGLFVAWLFPLLSNSRIAITTRALRQMPLTVKDLFVIRTASLFIPPFAWMVLAGSFAIAYPISHARRPVEGIIAASLFLVISWLTGLTASQLLSVERWRNLILLVLGVLIGGVATAVFYGQISFERYLSVISTKLVANPALGEQTIFSFGVLTVLLVIAAVLCAWSFRMRLQSVDTSRPQRTSSFSIFKGKTGPISAKDVRYFRRLLDTYLGFIVSLLACFYLAFAAQPGVEVFWLFIIFIMFPNAGLAFNSFGLDSNDGLDRYVLFPLTGTEVMLSKNISIITFMAMQVAPVLLFALWRLGVGPTVLGLIEATVLVFAFLTWGNVISVSHRFPMEFFRFSSGGTPIDALAGVIFGCLPGAIAMRLFSWRMWWAVALMVVVYFLMYVGSLVWSGRRFERVRL